MILGSICKFIIDLRSKSSKSRTTLLKAVLATSELTSAQALIERQKAELAELRKKASTAESGFLEHRKKADEERRQAERLRVSNDELRNEIEVCQVSLFLPKTIKNGKNTFFSEGAIFIQRNAK